MVQPTFPQLNFFQTDFYRYFENIGIHYTRALYFLHGTQMHIRYSYQLSLKYDFYMMHLTTFFRMYMPYAIAILYGVITNVFNY